ncbi:MAG: hemerythrin domain-containing protein [Ignavibacteria bacterium]|nr:hemerythrin domain-containing protein [Ignavibacteria bacterium]
MNLNNVNKVDPVKRFVEKETEFEEASPMNPPEAFSPSTVEPVAYKDMAPFLQKLMDEHKVFITVLDNFESALISWKKNDWYFNDEINNKLNELFSFLDKNTPGHNKKEEKLLFPLLHSRLLRTGEHSTGDEPKTAVDIMEDEHIKVAQLGALCLNFLGLGSRLEDNKSREIVFELAYEQGKTIVETMRLHIYREDETLFPLAMKLISKEEFEEMESH